MASQAQTPVRAFFARLLVAVVVSMAIIAPTVSHAQGIENLRKYAGIVVDAKSGKVLYESAADSKRYPASVAKVMTLYVLFQELSAGNLKLSTKMTVSRHAAAAVPTKLGLKAGSTVSVEDAIKSLVTLSANDMARVIAEHVSGTEAKFAQRMTTTARALGMRNTTYRNASGLPDGGQTTTVRDQAVLAIAIYQHFPSYYEFFQTKSFAYGKRVYGNHNRVLGYMGAVDGIKTGYINAAGSNLMTAARKDNRHIVVIAFGFNSSGARDQKVRELVGQYFDNGRRGDYLRTAMIPAPGRQGNMAEPVAVAQSAPAARAVSVSPMPLPGFRLAELLAAQDRQIASAQNTQRAPAPQPVAVAAAAPTPAPAPADLGLQPAVQAASLLGGAPEPTRRPDVIGAWLSGDYSLGAPPSALGQTMPSAPLDFSVTNSTGNRAANDNSAPKGSWIVQIGAAPDEANARGMLSTATSQVSALSDYRPSVERFEKNGQTFFRARFVGFGDSSAANSVCNQIKQQKLSCLAMQS